MASETPPTVDKAPTPSGSRWRSSLLVVILVVTGLLILAATEFPPRPPPISYSFVLIAGLDGTPTFNGATPGPTLTVSLDATVRVTLRVAPTASGPHSWMLVPLGGTPSSPVAFPGANTTDPTVGTPPGGSATATFTANVPGSYRYICGVDGHYLDGMWGAFNVTT